MEGEYEDSDNCQGSDVTEYDYVGSDVSDCGVRHSAEKVVHTSAVVASAQPCRHECVVVVSAPPCMHESVVVVSALPLMHEGAVVVSAPPRMHENLAPALVSPHSGTEPTASKATPLTTGAELPLIHLRIVV